MAPGLEVIGAARVDKKLFFNFVVDLAKTGPTGLVRCEQGSNQVGL